jgi:thioredoxin 1
MQKRIQEYTVSTLGSAISGSSAPFLVHFGTDWCPPCKRLERVLGELLSHWGDSVLVGKVNVEDEPDLAREFSVTRNPTVCLFRAGALVARREGFADKPELMALVNEP